MRLIFIPNFIKEQTEMKKSEKIEILEKEVTRLTELLKFYSASEFEKLKDQMEQEVVELRECKARYQTLIDEVKELKIELENKVRN